MGKPGMMVYFTLTPAIKALPLEARGMLFTAMLDYSEHQIEPELPTELRFAWEFVRATLDADTARYEAIGEKRRAAARERWITNDASASKSMQNEQTDATDATDANSNQTKSNQTISNQILEDKAAKPRQSRFTPPSLDEVRAFCEQRGSSVDPERFVDHYISVGWKIGKTQMRDWKAAVRNWERRQDESLSGDNKKNPGKSRYEVEYDG